MNEIAIVGISSNDNDDKRTNIFLKVTHNDEIFDWNIRMHPSFEGSFQDYVDQNIDNIHADINLKLEQWNNLNPKVQEIENYLGQKVFVEIKKTDIVKPTYPDYYIIRQKEYPSINEQLDAFWKGGVHQTDMYNKILQIKTKYSKNNIV